MSKQTKTITTTTCDICGAERWSVCDVCWKDLCHKHAREYSSYVFVDGGSIYYCAECEAKLIANPNPRFLAFQKIKQLRAEQEAFTNDFKRRCAEAEATVESLRKEAP